MADQQLFAKKPFSLFNALKGLTIGMANIIPGVSGGTIAVVTGIYDELVDAFGNFFSSEGGWRRNLFFLAPVIVGILIGNIALARLVGYLLETAPGPTNFGFIGLILGSTPYLVKRAGRQSLRPRYIVLFAAGLALVLWMGLAPRPDAAEPIREVTLATGALIIGAAFIASIAMIIPGISGSFLLLLIGIYSTMQVGFSTVNVPIIALFVVGTIAGVVVVSKMIAALLRKFHGSTYAVVIGLVVGSVIAIYPGFSEGSLILVDLAAFVVGALLSLTLGTSMKDRILNTRQAS